MIRSAFLIPTLGGGGAERATIDLAGSLAPDRHDVTIIVEKEGPELYDVPAHVRVIRLKAPSTKSALLPLRRTLVRMGPDVVYAALPHLNILAAAAVGTMRRRPRLVASVHNNLSAELPELSDGDTLGRLIPWSYRRADMVVAVSEGVASEARSMFGATSVVVIPDPIDVERIRSQSQSGSPHSWFSEPGRTILAMGRLVPQKGFDSLVAAFAVVHREDPAVRLVIRGEGPERNRLESQIADLGLEHHVALPGVTRNPFCELGAAFALVSASRYEGFGMALVEALALGVPVVATDCKYGPSEVLGGGAYGLLSKVDDPQDLAERISSLLSDSALATRLRTVGPAHAERYAPRPVAEQLEEAFSGLVAQ